MPTDVKMPQMGESIYEGTITKWLKKEGDFVKKDEPLYELSTDKVDTEIPSPVSGVVHKLVVAAGKKVPIHTVVALVDESGKGGGASPSATTVKAPVKVETKPVAPPTKTPEPVYVAPTTDGNGEKIFASPLVRKIARDEKIDLAQVTGSGDGGRITKEDILGYLESKKGAGVAVARIETATAAVPQAPSAPRPSGIVPMSPMRIKIAEHMVKSKHTSAHVHTLFEVDLSKIWDLREREKNDYERVYGVKLTFTPFFAMAAIEAIKEFPILNSSIDGTNIVYKREINLGMAVALPDGLIVPVVKNAEEKSFLGLARAINALAEKARTKKLAVDDIQGGTFTITNPGIYGGLFGTPVINQPQVAIMGIGGIEKRAVVINDAIAIRPMVYLVLGFDHRTIDGAVADQFMARVKQILQTWNYPIK